MDQSALLDVAGGRVDSRRRLQQVERLRREVAGADPEPGVMRVPVPCRSPEVGPSGGAVAGRVERAEDRAHAVEEGGARRDREHTARHDRDRDRIGRLLRGRPEEHPPRQQQREDGDADDRDHRGAGLRADDRKRDHPQAAESGEARFGPTREREQAERQRPDHCLVDPERVEVLPAEQAGGAGGAARGEVRLHGDQPRDRRADDEHLEHHGRVLRRPHEQPDGEHVGDDEQEVEEGRVDGGGATGPVGADQDPEAVGARHDEQRRQPQRGASVGEEVVRQRDDRERACEAADRETAERDRLDEDRGDEDERQDLDARRDHDEQRRREHQGDGQARPLDGERAHHQSGERQERHERRASGDPPRERRRCGQIAAFRGPPALAAAPRAGTSTSAPASWSGRSSLVYSA